MKKLLIIFSLVCSLQLAYGQNLVLNPSFENVNVGNLNCSWYTSSAQFNNAINNWTCPTGGSTDIFNTALATTCYCSPFSTNGASPGQQAPHTGQGFVNIVTYGNGGCDPWREYVQGELSTPLVAGTPYEVSFWVTLADKMSVGTNNIGVKFETGAYNQASNCGYYTAPELNYTGPIILDKDNWVQITFCYTPTVSGQDHFIIGNFFNDVATNTAPAAGVTTGNTIRYFVDDVVIEEVTVTGGDPGLDGTASVCPGDPAINLFDFLGGTPDTGGTWTGPSALGGGDLGTFTPGTSTPGIYTYEVSGTGGCISGTPATATVTVTAGSADATITAAGPFCANDAVVTLTAATAGGTWSGTGITNTSTGEFDPSTAGVGNHSITYDITGACSGTDAEVITVNANSDATITPVGPFCDTDPAITLNAVDGGGTWSGNGITNGTTGDFDPSTAGAGTHTITYTIAGACGDVQTTDIVVNSISDATITPVGPFCDTDPVILLTAVSAGGTWSGTGITNSATGEFDPSVSGSGTHTITYSIPGSCGDTQTEDIVVNQAGIPTITPAGPFCDSDAATNLLSTSGGGIWSGTGITDVNAGTFDPNIAGAGTHTITYTIAGACGGTDTEDIVVNITDDPTINPAGPFCQGPTAETITALTAGGSWSGNGITNTTSGEFTATTAGEGTHTITYTTSGLCPSVGNIDVIVLAPLSVSALQDSDICEGESVALSASGSGGDGALTYTWTDDQGANVGTGTNITVSPIVTTTYTVTIADGCNTIPQTDQVTVTVTPMPVINFTAADFEGCIPFTAEFLNSTIPAGTNCLWDFGDGISDANCGNASHTYSSPGCFDVTLTVSENQCSSSQTIQNMICVYEQAQAAFTVTPDEVDVENTTVTLENQSINATSFEWTYEGNVVSSSENLDYDVTEAIGNYTFCLKAMNDGMCNDSTCQNVIVTEQLLFYVPNIFTPDGDLFNETWTPVFTQGFDIYDYHLTIFNRWGEIIWESYNSSVGWNGHYGDGGLVDDGVYVWQIDFKSNQSDERIMKRGHVTVLK